MSKKKNIVKIMTSGEKTRIDIKQFDIKQDSSRSNQRTRSFVAKFIELLNREIPSLNIEESKGNDLP